MELNCIRLLVNNFDETFRFYAETLGLKVTWGEIGGDYASFDIGLPSGLSIFKTDLMAEAVGNSEKPMPSNCREKMAIIIKVENVDKTYEALNGKGVAFLSQPRDMTGWGIRMAHLRDPENNLLEIWSELPKSQWDKDLLEEAETYEP